MDLTNSNGTRVTMDEAFNALLIFRVDPCPDPIDLGPCAVHLAPQTVPAGFYGQVFVLAVRILDLTQQLDQTSDIIRYHQISSGIIRYHQISSGIIRYHQIQIINVIYMYIIHIAYIHIYDVCLITCSRLQDWNRTQFDGKNSPFPSFGLRSWATSVPSRCSACPRCPSLGVLDRKRIGYGSIAMKIPFLNIHIHTPLLIFINGIPFLGE
jgi:hypothetical protein